MVWTPISKYNVQLQNGSVNRKFICLCMLNHQVWKQTVGALFQNELKKWNGLVKSENGSINSKMVKSQVKWSNLERNGLIKNEMVWFIQQWNGHIKSEMVLINGGMF